MESNAGRITFGILLSALFSVNSALSQQITTYESQTVKTGARSMALADGIVSDKYDVTSMYSNAATLAYIQNFALLFDHSEERSIHASNENISIPFRLEKNQTIAVAASLRHVGYIGQSKDDEFKTEEFGYDFAYAVEIARGVSIGGTLDLRYGKSSTSKLWALSGLVGFYYLPAENLSFGMAFRQIGNGIIYSSDQVNTSLSSVRLPGSIDAGVAMRYPTIFRPLVMTLLASNEKIFRRDGIIYRGGGEFIFRQWLVGRIGYYFDSGQKTGSARYGIGLRVSRMNVDYSISPQAWSDELYRLSIAIGLN